MVDQKLITLLTVVETHNYSLAAKQLNLTQPAISQHIRQLEKENDIRIFNRDGNDIKLTESGEILVKYARRILSLYNDIEVKLNDAKKQSTSLTIGITRTSESNIVPEVLADFSIKNKGTHIRIVSDTIKNLYDKLSTYEIDIAVIEGNVKRGKYSSVLLDTDTVMAVISNESPLAKKKIVNINDLKKEKMILRNVGSGTRSLFLSQLENINMDIDDFNVILEIDNIATIKDLVEKNIAVSVLPKSCCYSELKTKMITALPIENMNMVREINLVFNKNSIEDNILNGLLECYKEKTMSIK